MPYDPGVEQYRSMQKRQYSSVPDDDNAMKNSVVGCFDEHEKYPYEQYLLAKFTDEHPFKEMTALDFGCGPGRMICRLAPIFGRVDGVDISPTCIATAER